MTGTVLASRYLLQSLLGQGGMGAVYEALDQTTGARVAVKVVHSDVMKDASSKGKDDSSKLTRFQREAKAAAAIQSEHVARTLDWGTDVASGQPYMVMELLEGEDLQQVLKRTEMLPPDVALRIIAQACDGLRAAHEARVMHRDIKPANLFLARTATGEIVVKILDFGIAKIRPESDVASGETTGLTRTGSMLGSPRYMSPEQARGSRSLDHRTDLWSLGVVLYRMLCGRLPHEDAEAVGEFIVMLCSEPPRPVEQLAPWVSAEIAAVVDDALQIVRDERFESAEAMLAAVRPLLPNGDRLRTEDLAPVAEATRRNITIRAPAARGSGRGSTTGSSSDATVPLPTGRLSRRALADQRKDDTATPNTLTNAPAGGVSAPRRSAATIVVAVAAVVLGVGAVGLMRGAGLFSEPGAGSGDGPGSSGGTSTGAPERRAKLAIAPADATVEIDGAAVVAKDGAVEIAGAQGSTHRVRVRKDGQEKTFDVVLGASGAEPAKVELALPAVSATATATASAAVTGAAPLTGRLPVTKKTAAPVTTTAPGPTKNPLIPERFE